jgi:hypothetical protein
VGDLGKELSSVVALSNERLDDFDDLLLFGAEGERRLRRLAEPYRQVLSCVSVRL